MRSTIISQVLCLILLLLTAGTASAQTGKISGVVTEAATGNPLPGVNIVVLSDGEPTTIGAQTDIDGFYAILNVAPGTYNLRASYLGFAAQVQTGVNVSINLTTELNFALQEEAVGLEEVVVEAREPVVRPDVSASVANLSAANLQNVPVSSVQEAVTLQAGIEPGLSVRGSSLGEVAFMVDGMSMRLGRDNTPFTGISYTAIEAVQVQTGGFNAEYGNVRSGLINVVTKEGRADRYTADVLLQFEPASERYFGKSPNDPSAYWMRPYLDPEVAFTGTRNGGWDLYTQYQYPEFAGWNSVAASLANDDDPSNDLSPEQLQQVFLHRHRKSLEIESPDYTVDLTVGGPAPLSRRLGDLRFTGSYRQKQTAYVVPQRRDAYRDRIGQLKLTSDVGRGMKLTLQGMYSEEKGLNAGYAGGPQMYRGETPPYPWSGMGLINAVNRDLLFALDALALQDITRNMVGASFTHALNSRTYYELRLQRSSTKYLTGPGPLRSDRAVTTIGGMVLDEAPFGWQPAPSNDYSGLRLGGHWGHNRDSSSVSAWAGEFAITSQVNRYAQIKAGAELIVSDYDTNYGIYDDFFAADNRPKFRWSRTPMQGAVFGQTKLEFRGMIANLGLRMDYFDPSGDWYVFGPYARAFSPLFGMNQIDDVLEATRTNRQFSLSPRVGVSFPVTETSKFYVNYGHFRQMLDPNDLYLLREITYTGAIDQVGNPNHPMPRTVAYEIGYSRSLFDQYLFNISGYYKALDRQPRSVRYVSLDGEVDYTTRVPLNYADIRGFEITLSKNSGRWVRGFANFTYMAVKRGNFGFNAQFENQLDQLRLERESRAHYQERPVPEPYARMNVEFIVPREFGPTVAGVRPLSDWRLDLLGQWRAGMAFTWAGAEGQTIAGLENNIRWSDYYNLDLRLSKAFSTSLGQAQFFIDVSNVLNLKHMHESAGFEGSKDWERYMQSLHLPDNIFDDIDGEAPYNYIRGNDRPGDYRKPGTEYVPIEIVKDVNDVSSPAERPLYYVSETGNYMWWRNGDWEDADKGYVKRVLDDKQYIDMPNETYFTFLNPRRVIFGLRVTL